MAKGHKGVAGQAVSADRKVRRGDVSVRCQLIATAIKESQSLPAAVTKLLGGMLSESLEVAAEKRHMFQDRAVEMAGEVLGNLEVSLVESLAAATAMVSGTDTEKAARSAAAALAAQALSARQADAASRREGAAEAKARCEEAWRALASLKDLQAEGDAPLQAVGASKANLGALAEEVARLRQAAATKAQLAALLRELAPFGFDGSLVKSLHFPLSKPPAARTPFDELVLLHLDLAVAGQVAAFDLLLATGEPAHAERAATVAAAEKLCEQLQQAEDEADEALRRASEEQDVAQRALDAARAAVGSFSTDLLRAAKEVDDARAQLVAFQTGPLTAFRELRERTTPPVISDAKQAEPGLVEPAPEAQQGLPANKLAEALAAQASLEEPLVVLSAATAHA